MKTLRSFSPPFLAITLAVGMWAAAPAKANPPDFTVKAALSESTFRLSEARGKYVVVHFLLKTECPVCLNHTREHLEAAAKTPDVIHIFLKPDSDAEIKAWAKSFPANVQETAGIYRDPEAALATKFAIPDGYAFHGQTVHFPATVLLGPDGKEIHRQVGKNNRDRLSVDQLEAKLKEARAKTKQPAE